MRFPSDPKDFAGVFDRNSVIWACSQVEAALESERSPSAVGWREKSYMEARVISALMSLSDTTMREAADLFGLSEEQGLARRRKFLDAIPEHEQRSYLESVKGLVRKAVSHDE